MSGEQDKDSFIKKSNVNKDDWIELLLIDEDRILDELL